MHGGSYSNKMFDQKELGTLLKSTSKFAI